MCNLFLFSRFLHFASIRWACATPSSTVSSPTRLRIVPFPRKSTTLGLGKVKKKNFLIYLRVLRFLSEYLRLSSLHVASIFFFFARLHPPCVCFNERRNFRKMMGEKTWEKVCVTFAWAMVMEMVAEKWMLLEHLQFGVVFFSSIWRHFAFEFVFRLLLTIITFSLFAFFFLFFSV